MKRVFISMPYNDDDRDIIDMRYEQAVKYCAKLLEQNIVPVCPVVSGHAIALQCPDIRFDDWLKYSLTFLTKEIDEVHLLTMNGWDKSNGVKEEIDISIDLEIPLTYIYDI